MSRRAPRAGGRATAVRPAGVLRPAVRRTAEGTPDPGFRRVDRPSSVACFGGVREVSPGTLLQRPLRSSRARVALGAGERWVEESCVERRVGALPVQRRAERTGVAPRPVARSSRPSGRASVRLTRRGRAVVLLVSLGIALAALTLIGPHSAATSDGGTPVQTRTVVVGPGDTLWGIASDVAAPGQVRDLIHQIEELNALSGPSVTVGQQIAVPVG